MSITMVMRRLNASSLVDRAIVAEFFAFEESGYDQAGSYLDLGKAWAAVAAMLPQFPLLEGDRSLELPQDLDYGPPFVFDPNTVRRLHVELEKVLADGAETRVQAVLHQIDAYPDVWHEANGAEWILGALRDLSAFIEKAVRERQSVVAMLL
jgi:hypothetical protein